MIEKVFERLSRGRVRERLLEPAQVPDGLRRQGARRVRCATPRLGRGLHPHGNSINLQALF
jgi:hypothetical protein